jgi:hypothetical protein
MSLLDIEVFISISTGLIPFFIWSRQKKSSESKFLIAFTVLSIVIDFASFYLHLKKENNLFLFNIYDYLAIFGELFCIAYVSGFNRKLQVLIVFIVIFYWLSHGLYNYEFGFYQLSSIHSFLLSFFVCFFAAIAAIKIILSDYLVFKEKELFLIPILGFFIFETASMIPVSTNNLKLSNEERVFLSEFYLHLLVFGNISRNLLFTIYFLAESRRARKISQNNTSLVNYNE